jgi:hypothetical protein
MRRYDARYVLLNLFYDCQNRLEDKEDPRKVLHTVKAKIRWLENPNEDTKIRWER